MRKKDKTILGCAVIVVIVFILVLVNLAHHGIIGSSRTSDVPKVEETKVEKQPNVEKTKTEKVKTEETKMVQQEVKEEFKLRKVFWIEDKEYLVGLKKLNSVIGRLEDLHLKGMKLVIADEFNIRPDTLWIDYRASPESIKKFIKKNISAARAESEAERAAAEKNAGLEKVLRSKGLNIRQSGLLDEREYLVVLKKLNTLAPEEIKDLQIENIQIVASISFYADLYGKPIRIDHEASLEKIKKFIAVKIKEMKEQNKPKKELKEQIGKLEKEIKEKISK